VMVALVVAVVLLPKEKPEPLGEGDEGQPGETAAPVLVH
jgi:hypothetical protein